MPSDSKRTVVSLFSGAGGFDWGFHKAGYETRLAVEILPQAAKTLAHNLALPIIPVSAEEGAVLAVKSDDLPAVVQGDIRKINFSDLSGTEVDVLIGGPPCQDFSMTKGNKREGENGTRGKLYQHFLRALMFIQPKAFIFENVPGFISANNGKPYKAVLSDVADLDELRLNPPKDTQYGFAVPSEKITGYKIVFNGIVDAPYFGVPQTRRRLIIIGIRSDLANNPNLRCAVDGLSRVMSGDCWPFKKFPLTAIEVFEGKPLTELSDIYKSVMQAYRPLAEQAPWAGARAWQSRTWDKLRFDIVEDYYTANGLDYTSHDQALFDGAMQHHKDILEKLGWLNNPVRNLSMSDNMNKLITQSKSVMERMENIPPGENAAFVDGTPWKVAHKEISFIYRRPQPLKPAWTVMAYGGGGTYGYHYERSRSILTLRERARIQTFSDDFIFQGKDIRAQIGEAVPPLLAQRTAEAIDDLLGALELPSSMGKLYSISLFSQPSQLSLMNV